MKFFALLLVLMVLACASPSEGIPRDTAHLKGPPNLTLYDLEQLAFAKTQFQQGRAPYTIAADSLLSRAEKALLTVPTSVTTKTPTPASGDKHDYYSMGPYWWPDTTKPDGLPYIRRDGYVNPQVAQFDHHPKKVMIAAVKNLTWAYFYTNEEKYAAKAVEFLRVWFLNVDTKMNPNLQHGQAIPGIVDGRGIGIIETTGFMDLVNMIELLKAAKSLDAKTYADLQSWFSEYTKWLVTSDYGWDERMWHNNHGTCYDGQVATFALFAGEDSLARLILDSAKVKRIGAHIRADGSQPWELERTKAMSYSIMNLHHLIENAIVAEKLGIDHWNYASPEGGTIADAVKYLAQFYTTDTPFPYQQIGGIEKLREKFYRLLWLVEPYVDDAEIQALFASFPSTLADHDLLHLSHPRSSTEH